MANVEFSERDFKCLLENYLKSLNPDVNIEVEFYITNNYVGIYETLEKKCNVKVNIIKSINVGEYKGKQKIEQKLSEEEIKNILSNILGEEIISIKFNIGCGGLYEDFDTLYNVSVEVNEQKLRLRM